MKKNVLLPTDFSDNAWTAAQYAIDLYAGEECTFYFLNSYAMPSSSSAGVMTSRLREAMKDISERDLDVQKAQAKKFSSNPKHKFEIISTSGDLVPAIISAVKKYNIDLVVTGTKGATGVNKFFMGSNTVSVIQNLKSCPVLAVPDAIVFKTPKNIAFPTDFSREYESKEIKALLDFTDLLNTHLNILHITTSKYRNEIQDNNRRELENILENYEHTFHDVPKTTTKSDGINNFIKNTNIDILAIVNYKHNFIEGIINEPIIKNIGFQPTVPILVIPN